VADWQAGISRDLYLDAMERERGLLHCSRIAAGPADRPRLCDITERGWRWARDRSKPRRRPD